MTECNCHPDGDVIYQYCQIHGEMAQSDRLEQKLDELVKIQGACTSNMFDSNLSKQIRDLEWIRGRPYLKCMKCGADLTLTNCPHHKKKKRVVEEKYI